MGKLNSDSKNWRDDWCTPMSFVAAITKYIDAEFVIDLAATSASTRCPYWFSEQDDTLKQDWFAHLDDGWGFLNPPFSKIREFAPKILAEANKGCKLAVILPARVEQKFFHQLGDAASEILFPLGRIAYEFPPGHPKAGKKSAPQFASCVMLFQPEPAWDHDTPTQNNAEAIFWDWRKT